LTGGDGVLPAEELVGIEVLPGTTRSVTLNDALSKSAQKAGGVSAFVQSTNNVRVVAERSIRYQTVAVSGSAAEVGAPRPSTGWFLPAATLNPSTDTVVVMNPGSAPATVDLELLFGGRAPLTPGDLQGRTIPPGGRLKIGIGEWTSLETTLVRLVASTPVVAERFSYSATPDDVGAVMGFPLE
jgi:hypothetical protein